MNDKKGVFFAVVIFNIIAVLFAMFCCIYIMSTPTPAILVKLTAAMALVAIVCSTIYAIYGYKKSGAKFMKLFMLFFILMKLGDITNNALTPEIGWPGVLCYTLIFGLLVALATGTDLGRVRSFICSFAVLGIELVAFILGLLLLPDLFADAELATIYLLRIITSLIMAILLNLMMISKYADKASRGK